MILVIGHINMVLTAAILATEVRRNQIEIVDVVKTEQFHPQIELFSFNNFSQKNLTIEAVDVILLELQGELVSIIAPQIVNTAKYAIRANYMKYIKAPDPP